MMSAGAAEATAVVAETNKMIDLAEKLDKSECYARNESSQYPFTNLFMGDTRLGCKSDADEQLIIHVAFNEHVKVSKSSLKCVDECVDISRENKSHLTLSYLAMHRFTQ